MAVAPPDAGSAEQLALEIPWARTVANDDGDAVQVRDRSCYFNSGCCCFSNGDITGIEFTDGEIRLVRWTTDPMDPEDRVIEARDLTSIFSALGS